MRKRILILGAIFVVLLTLFIIKANTGIRTEKKQGLFVPKLKKNKPAHLQPLPKLPQIEELAEEDYLTSKAVKQQAKKEEKERLPETSLKDLPLEQPELQKKLAEEEAQKAEQQDQRLKKNPNFEQMRELKRKGLIIY